MLPDFGLDPARPVEWRRVATNAVSSRSPSLSDRDNLRGPPVPLLGSDLEVHRRACSRSELNEGKARSVVIDGQIIVIVLSEGALYAIEDKCSHGLRVIDGIDR